MRKMTEVRVEKFFTAVAPLQKWNNPAYRQAGAIKKRKYYD